MTRQEAVTALRAATLYFMVVFAVAFVLGTIRVLIIAPRVGDLVAVALETPILLCLSWIVARRVIAGMAVPHALAVRAMMGAFAFYLLIAAETALGLIAFGRSPADMLASYATLPGALGLAAQLGFAAIPAIQERLGS